jgi:hypothetical protein
MEDDFDIKEIIEAIAGYIYDVWWVFPIGILVGFLVSRLIFGTWPWVTPY